VRNHNIIVDQRQNTPAAGIDRTLPYGAKWTYAGSDSIGILPRNLGSSISGAVIDHDNLKVRVCLGANTS
jgi:hypothetical protein